jgi:predicted CXXCH cytochrome family protein
MIANRISRISILIALLAIPSVCLWAKEEAAAPDEIPTNEESQAQVEPAAQAAPAAGKQSSGCITCHMEAGGKLAELVTQFQGSIHGELDFTCTDCHGGDDSTTDIGQAKSVESGFIGKPEKAAIPEMCARCHGDAELMRQYGNIRTDQLELYKTSQHGITLYESGDSNVATCVDCHTSHNILQASNPLSSVNRKNQPETCGHCHADSALTDQYGMDSTIPDSFIASQHGIQLFEHNDPGAPACSSCHGSHGAQPPGVATLENVCGTCHIGTEKYYNQSRHAEVFPEYGFGQCITCHNPHTLPSPTDDFLSEDADPSCVSCHAPDSEHYAKIMAMREDIVGIKELHRNALDLVAETEETTHMSMYDMTPQVELINTKMLSARAMLHAADPDAMDANFAEANSVYEEIKAFTERLIDRARVNKMTVVILASVLVLFGLFMFVYRRLVLDVSDPWVCYQGESLDDKNDNV